MEIAQLTQLISLLALQQANAAAKIADLDGNADNGAAGNTANTLLFAALLETALTDKGSAVSLNNLPEPAESHGKAQSQTMSKHTDFDELIQLMGQKYGVDSGLLKQVVSAESGFNPEAVSPAGAKGLMQLMPGTAQTYGVNNVFDPVQNLEGGTHFLKDLLKKYHGDVSLALAAYNAGPGAVDKYRGIPPYQETQAYVKKITANLPRQEWKG